MTLLLLPGSRDDNGGDIAWRFRVTEAVRGGPRGEVWGGVRATARALVAADAAQWLTGDLTPALLAYAAAAARRAQEAGHDGLWVTLTNFEAMRTEVRRARRTHEPLYQSSEYESVLQWGDPLHLHDVG